MKKIISAIVITICVISSAKAAQKYQINKYDIVSGNISREEPNKIMVEGDRVKEIMGANEELYEIKTDSITGQVYIRVKDKDIKNIFLSLITENGKSQDLKLRIKEKISGQSIIIEVPKSEEVKLKGAKHRVHEEIGMVVEGVMSDKEVRNLASKTMACNDKKVGKRESKSKYETELLKELNIEGYKVEVWEIMNCQDEELNLKGKERNFSDKETRAVVIEKPVLVNKRSLSKIYIIKN